MYVPHQKGNNIPNYLCGKLGFGYSRVRPTGRPEMAFKMILIWQQINLYLTLKHECWRNKMIISHTQNLNAALSHTHTNKPKRKGLLRNKHQPLHNLLLGFTLAQVSGCVTDKHSEQSLCTKLWL